MRGGASLSLATSCVQSNPGSNPGSHRGHHTLQGNFHACRFCHGCDTVLCTSVRTGVKLPSVTNSIGMELIEIPAGKFTMGSPVGEKGRQENEAQITVTLIKPFSLGKTEVTQGQWKQVMSTEPWNEQPLVKADKD